VSADAGSTTLGGLVVSTFVPTRFDD